MTKEQLRAARAALGMPQSEIAARLGVSASGYRKWEAGTAQPHPLLERALRDLEQERAAEIRLLENKVKSIDKNNPLG